MPEPEDKKTETEDKKTETKETNGDDKKNNGEHTVPLYKLKNASDKLKNAEAELEKYKTKEQDEKEDKLKKDKKYEELLSEKDKSIEELKSVNDELLSEKQLNKVYSIVTKEVAKFTPHDIDDVIKFIDLSDLDIDDNGKIDNSVVKKKIEEVKKAKPYLFGTSKNDTIETSENGKTNVSVKDKQVEFRDLLNKGHSRTRVEALRFAELAKELQLEKDKAKNSDNSK